MKKLLKKGASPVALLMAVVGYAMPTLADDCADGENLECLTIIGTQDKEGDEAQAKRLDLSGQNNKNLSIDSLLLKDGGVKLFRRANSFTAHPTAQGVTTRGIGTNAASRMLVTLDGVPLNDPFGGWIYWSSLYADDFAYAEVIKGGGSAALAGQALAGQIRLNSFAPDHMAPKASISYGSNNHKRVTASGGHAVGGHSVSGSVAYGESDGDFLFNASDRGPIDIPASFDYLSVNGAYGYTWGTHEVKLVVRHFEENRLNGYSLSPNRTEAQDIALHFNKALGFGDFEARYWYKDRQFSNTFVAARDDRTTERQVLDQHDVPAWSLGGLMRLVNMNGFDVGVDFSRNSGETNEFFRNLGAGFTRERKAGGDQKIFGSYVRFDSDASDLITSDHVAINAMVRLDRYETYNGSRLELNLDDQSVNRQEDYTAQSGTLLSGGFKIASKTPVQFYGAVNHSWRLPTLNEYYRPFRVGNDITEANGNLKIEKLTMVEAGLKTDGDWGSLSANLYAGKHKDSVGNITIGFGPGFFPLGGFVPTGGVLRQRENIDKISVKGVEIDAVIKSKYADLSLSYALNKSEITDFDMNPDLVGKRPVQTPKHTLSASLAGEFTVQVPINWQVSGRYLGGMYDDDLNSRYIDDVFLMDASVSYGLTDGMTLNVSATNLFDKKVISALSASGLEIIAQRRNVMVSLAYTF